MTRQEIEKGNNDATQTAEVQNTIVEQIKKNNDFVACLTITSNEQAQRIMADYDWIAANRLCYPAE